MGGISLTAATLAASPSHLARADGRSLEHFEKRVRPLRSIAGLLLNLKARGLLQDTLVL
jgi:hypothetical protein